METQRWRVEGGGLWAQREDGGEWQAGGQLPADSGYVRPTSFAVEVFTLLYTSLSDRVAACTARKIRVESGTEQSSELAMHGEQRRHLLVSMTSDENMNIH